MTYAGVTTADAAVTRIGGVPLAGGDFAWPLCRTCSGNMQFVAQIALDDLEVDAKQAVLLIFMCQNEPGMCDDWDPSSGGNQALIVPAGLAPATVPGDGETLMGAVSAVAYADVEGGYGQALERWAGQTDRAREVLGQLGGEPAWIQSDETPACPACGEQMTFVAQLEEGPDYATAANFGGGGCAYAFTCTSCRQAAFLWQC